MVNCTMPSNDSSCNIVLSIPLLRIICATNGASVLVCLLASALVFGLKLHKKVVYRLALCQVLAALVFSVVQVFQIVFVDYSTDSDVYRRVCVMIAFLSLYTQWTKLVLAMWVTVHLFCFVVLHKNLARLEMLYVATSLLVPAAFAGAALGINSYGLGEFGCWIYVTCRNSSDSSFRNLFLERLILWDGPAMAILLIASAAMVVILIKLSCKMCQQRKYKPVNNGGQFCKALKQLLPLAAFPLLFYAFIIPQFAFHVYQFEFETFDIELPRGKNPLYIATSISFSLWSFASGLTLTTHVCLVTLSRYCKVDKDVHHGGGRYGTIDDEGPATIRRDSRSKLNSTSATRFSLPIGSINCDT